MNTKKDFIKELVADAEKHDKYFNEKEYEQGMFLIKPVNKWIEIAKNRPIPKMLFDCLWFEGEICILFSDTNLGKSILAVQIADSISTGKSILGFRSEAEQQKVLYFDFELSDKQFETRYSENYHNHYRFNDRFYRAEINPDAELPHEFENFESYLFDSLEKALITSHAKILIVDNITYLSAETERAKDALPLMKHLKSLKQKYGLSVLVLAHTPKRDLSKPITRNDLQGSKMLINFCDSSFTIGECSQDKGLRYIKQIKVRNTDFMFDKDNVVVCRIEKVKNFLQFEYENFGREEDYLKQFKKEDVLQLEKDILELKKCEPKLSLNEIAKRTDTYKMNVKRILDSNKS
jgi:RecA-family ATPase